MMSFVFALLSTIPSAWAGGGPWTLPGGAQNLYVGLSQSRFSTLQGDEDVQELGEIQGTTLMAIGTIGLLEGLEVELSLPWQRTLQMDQASSVCLSKARPRDYCASSTGIGPLQATVKGRILDEGALRPVTVSLAAVLRNGTPTADLRQRLTAIGDGQTDVGAMASLGRTGSLQNNGWYSAAATLGYWYRLPLPTDGGDKVPADQVEYAARALVAPVRRVGLGPVVAGFHRLGGIEFSELSPSDPNGFPALQAAQLKLGGELLVSGDAGVSLSISALQALWARNNPRDTRVISMGLGWYAEPR